MKSLEDILKEKHGIKVDKSEVSQEMSDETKAYWKKVKELDKTGGNRPDLKLIKKMLVPFSPQKKFTVDESNRDFVEKVCYYFAQNKKFLEYSDHNDKPFELDKGLLIAGTCGLGKSYTINTMYRIFQNFQDFTFGYVSALDVVNDFNTGGDKAVAKYKLREWYFDDFGTEDIGSHYGKNEVFKNVLESRYNKFVEEGLKTHLSTNLLPSQIEERYGDRVWSRIQQMFNIIVVTGEDRRK